MSLFLILFALVGYALADLRIPNSPNVTIEQFPYQVSLVYSDVNGYCGGAVIGPTYVLTATHCVQGYHSTADRVQVRVGSAYLGRGGVVHKVKQITYSEVESLVTPHGDLAILQLSEPIKFGTTVQPIAVVPKGTEAKHGQMVLATGWGSSMSQVQHELVHSDALQMVRLPLIQREMCNASYYSWIPLNVTDRRICAGGGLKWTLAAGNFGGSLVNEKRQLIGILSWTILRRPGYPAVFTNLAAQDVREFIQKNTPI